MITDIVGRRTLNSILEFRIATHPDKPCFVVPGDRTYSYKEFGELRERAATIFEAYGVKHGDAVILHIAKTIYLGAALYGLYEIGAVAAMSNPANTSREVLHIAALSNATLCIIDDSVDYQNALISHGLNVVRYSVFLERLNTDQLGGNIRTARKVTRTEDAATMLFTSGTTASPKCVVYKHGHQVYGAESYMARLGLAHDGILMHHFPIFHMNGLNQLNAALLAGATMLWLPRFRSELFDDYLEKYKPTATYLNGTHIKMIRNRNTVLKSRCPLHRVGMALQMSPGDYQWFIDKYGDILAEGYGMTETITTCLCNPVAPKKRGSCGLPIAGYMMQLINDNNQPCAVGETGQLLVKSISRWGLIDGYEGNLEATTQALKDGWFHSGDLLRQDEDGYYYFIDRHNDIIKRAGENIASAEVERVLEENPLVEEAAVVGRIDRLREEVPVAFVVLRGKALEAGVLTEWCEARLAKFKIPVEFYFVKELTKNSVGKIDKKILRGELSTKHGEVQ